jgi:hypothetical protein
MPSGVVHRITGPERDTQADREQVLDTRFNRPLRPAALRILMGSRVAEMHPQAQEPGR